MKHTPGPWYTCLNANGDMRQYIRSDADDLAICKLIDPNRAWEIGRLEANARLISQAPDLLAGLKAAIGRIEALANEPGDRELIESLHLVIRRAEDGDL